MTAFWVLGFRFWDLGFRFSGASATMAELVRLDGGVVVEGGGEHRHAWRRLRAELPGTVMEAGGSVPDGAPTVRLVTAAERAEGSFAIRASGGESSVVEIECGPFSGVIYGVEKLVQRQVPDGAVQIGTVEQAPGLMSQRNDGHAVASC